MAREIKYDWFFDADNTVYGDYDTVNYELRGYGGNDKLFGNDGDDVLLGGDGNDSMWGGDGDDEMSGGSGNDTFYIDRGNDSYFGGTGSDTLTFDKVFVLSSYNIFGGIMGHQTSITDFAVGFSFDVESGATFAGTNNNPTTYSDNWGVKTVANSVETIRMTELDDVLRDNNASRTLVGNGGNDLIEGRGGADTIIGGAGSDTASYESSGGNAKGDGVVVNLYQGTGSGNDAEGDTLSSIENVIGSRFADVIIGSNGANRLESGAGDDVLTGLGGRDILLGGAGRDTFTYLSTGDSGVAASARDSIVDFQRGLDKIDLSGIDARPDYSFHGLTFDAGDQRFAFIGTDNFSGQAGQLRAVTVNGPDGNFALVSGDVNGDRIADFSIEVYQDGQLAPILAATDFIL